MALVNLNNNNNVMQREKDKENERINFPNNKVKSFSWIPEKKDVKFEQKTGKQQQFVDSQNQKNKKEKVRRKQNAKSNNINIPRTEFVPPPKVVTVAKTDINGNGREDNRISTGTMTVPSKNHKNNTNCRYQYEPNQIFTLGMQMNHPRSNPNRLTPPIQKQYRNNMSPPSTDSSSRVNGHNFDMGNNTRYHGMNVYPHHQWLHGGGRGRYNGSQPQQNENTWHHHNNQYNWNQNSPPHNSFNNRLNRSWKSTYYMSQNNNRNKNPNFSEFRRPDYVPSPSPPYLKSENPLPLKKSSSKNSLNDKSSRSSVNSSPDNHSSELEYDSDTSKVSSVALGSVKSAPNVRQNHLPNVNESRSAPELSTFSDFQPSSDYVEIGYSPLSLEAHPGNGNGLSSNPGFYQQGQRQIYNGSHQSLTINNWVSNLDVGGNGVVGKSVPVPPGFQMYVPDVSYDVLHNNGEFVHRSVSKESLADTDGSGNTHSSVVSVQTDTNNSMLYLNPNTFPHQVHQSATANRSRHVMNNVHRFNPSPSNKKQAKQMKVAPETTISPDSIFYNSTLPFVKDEPKDLLCGSKWDPISKDIWNKFISSQQSEHMYNKKIQLWRYLYYNIKQNYPQYGLYMVGSTLAGFGTDSSDVDMCLVCRENQEPSLDLRTNAMVTLSQIQKLLQGYPVFDEFQLIQARVPILRFKDVHYKILVDLNYNNCVGIRNTHLLHCYAQMDWRLRPLVLIVKLWAQFHNINDARNATLPSYSLVLMVIHFLQCGVKPAVLPCLHKIHPEKFSLSRDYTQINMNEVIDPISSENRDTLGELFVRFLEYYSKFDYTKYAISIRTASCLPIEQCRQMRTPKNDAHQWKVLCIEEPFDRTNTARSVYDYEVFERVKTTFLTSWQLLKKSNRLNSVFTTPLFQPLYQPQQYSPTYTSNYIIFSPIPVRTNNVGTNQSNKVNH